MTKTNKPQRGSAHVLVVVILVLVLITALGWIFWQNFIHKETTQTDTGTEKIAIPTPKNDTQQLTDGKTSDIFGPFLTFKYPSNWQLTEKIQGPVPPNQSVGGTSQTIELRSPTGKFSVVYSIAANGGIGGMCLPEETGRVESISYSQLTNFSQVGYATYIVSDKAGGYTAYSGIVGNRNASVKKGDSACDLAYAGVIGGLKKDTENVQNIMIFEASVHPAEKKEGMDASYYRELYSGQEFETAKSILLSTRLQ